MPWVPHPLRRARLFPFALGAKGGLRMNSHAQRSEALSGGEHSGSGGHSGIGQKTMKNLVAIFLIVAGAAALVALSLASKHNQRENDDARRMAINHVSEAHVVSIDVTITNDSDFAIVMPSCGTLLQQYVVCFPTAYFEQYDGANWKRVDFEPHHLYGELPEPPLTPINPHASIQVHAAFSPDTYSWRQDQNVRFVIPTWPASDKGRTNKNEILFVTGPLKPPSVGRLAFLPQ